MHKRLALDGNRLPLRQLALIAYLLAASIPLRAGSGIAIHPRTDTAPTVSGLDEPFDTLRRDDNRPAYVFRFPDAYGDDWRNMRFTAPADCRLTSALFAFPRRGSGQWTSGDPDLIVCAWRSGADSLPDPAQILARDTVHYGDFADRIYNLDSAWTGGDRQWVRVDLARFAVDLPAGGVFHLGYSAARNSAEDSLAILSDDGSPETDYASEWYNGRFVRLRDSWRGVNLFIRAIVETAAAISPQTGMLAVPGEIILHPAYPNPFNPTTKITLQLARTQELRIRVFDLLGREQSVVADGLFGAGTHALNVDGRTWPGGVYFIRVESGSEPRTQLIILLK